MTCHFNNQQQRSSAHCLRWSSNNPLYEALDIVQTDNRRYIRIIYYIPNNIFKLCFKIIRLVREIRSLRRRVHALEERVEVQQETIVENVSRSWIRDAQYERLLRERNRLQARVSNLEDEIRRWRSNNDDNNNNRGSGSRERMVGFGFFGGN